MPAYTQEELRELYRRLPEDLKDAIFSVEVAEKIEEIGKQSGLTLEQTGFVAEEIGYVLLGITRPQEFTQSISKRLKADTDKARSIARDVTTEIFAPIRETLRKTHQFEVTMEEVQKTEPLIRKTPEAQQKMGETIVLQPKEGRVPPPPPIIPPGGRIPPIDLRETSRKSQMPPTPPQILKPQEPSRPPQAAPPKIPPIDLREQKPQTPREAPRPPEKKIPYSGIDPYREPTN